VLDFGERPNVTAAFVKKLSFFVMITVGFARKIEGMKRFLCLMQLVCAIGVILTFGHGAIAEAPATQPSKIRIVLAGDSTVTDRTGWGIGFASHLSDHIECINLSRGGRSSGSFVKEGSWQKVLNLKPDYVLVQFGHNDQPGHGAERETDPDTGYKKNMQRYVDEARAAGIKIILVTSLSRRQWGSDGKIHSTLVPYVAVVKKIATDNQVPLIDLHARSIELYEKIGREGTDEISPPKTADSKNGDTATTQGSKLDGTHLNSKGSVVIGKIVAEELKKAVPDLAAYIN
jgi:lysophospholipase L1-like esterase